VVLFREAAQSPREKKNPKMAITFVLGLLLGMVLGPCLMIWSLEKPKPRPLFD
jgi:LPS O-antigen subunit length determinant protein (WzzB/FepE family)